MSLALLTYAIEAMNNEWCPNAPEDDPGHCQHWYDAEPCCRCSWDGGDKGDVED